MISVFILTTIVQALDVIFVMPNQTINDTETRTLIQNSDVTSGICKCDVLSVICDWYCCCDDTCQQTDIDTWDTDGKCIGQFETQQLSYPRCQDMALDPQANTTYYNSINHILCVQFANLPYSGVYINANDDTVATNTLDLKQFYDGQQLDDQPYVINPLTSDSVTVQFFNKSGTPGYRMGYPLIIGYLESTQLKALMQNQFQLYAGDLTGTCIVGGTIDSTIVGMPLNFGEDVVLQCYTKFSGTTNTYAIFTNFKYIQNLYISRWGTPSNSIDDWIMVNVTTTEMSIPQPPTTFVNRQIITIFYQKVGYVGKLQNKIISAESKDITSITLPNTDDPISLTLQIRFIELNTQQLDITSTASLRDTITPYIKKIFLPFTYQLMLLPWIVYVLILY